MVSQKFERTYFSNRFGKPWSWFYNNVNYHMFQTTVTEGGMQDPIHNLCLQIAIQGFIFHFGLPGKSAYSGSSTFGASLSQVLGDLQNCNLDQPQTWPKSRFQRLSFRGFSNHFFYGRCDLSSRGAHIAVYLFSSFPMCSYLTLQRHVLARQHMAALAPKM